MNVSNVHTKDFISLYFQYVNESESPIIYHRWAALSTVAALLGRNLYFRLGHFTIYPNMYAMLVGSAGARKSSAIKCSTSILALTGYKTFAAARTRQEKFLQDLAEQAQEDGALDILDQNLFGGAEEDKSRYENSPPAECFVAADEFNNFIGLANLDFISLLGELWDYKGVYDHRLKNSKSIYIPNPTINILGGNTPTGLAKAFPPETIGQGFFSRLILIFSEPTNERITFPALPDEELRKQLVQYLIDIRKVMKGEIQLDADARELIDSIYKSWKGVPDVRFEQYNSRRLIHLLKLIMVLAATKLSMTITKAIVVEANTLLSFAEHLMPKALGEFGTSKNAQTTNKVMDIIDNAEYPISFQGIWKCVYTECDSRAQLTEIINNLQVADKLQVVNGGYLPIKKVVSKGRPDAINWAYLTPYERSYL